MDRRAMVTYARALGGQLLDSDGKTMWFGFPSDEKTLQFREAIPFENLWGSTDGIAKDVPSLIVYLDQPKARKEAPSPTLALLRRCLRENEIPYRIVPNGVETVEVVMLDGTVVIVMDRPLGVSPDTPTYHIDHMDLNFEGTYDGHMAETPQEVVEFIHTRGSTPFHGHIPWINSSVLTTDYLYQAVALRAQARWYYLEQMAKRGKDAEQEIKLVSDSLNEAASHLDAVVESIEEARASYLQQTED